MTFESFALPLPMKIPGTRVVLAWGVSERGKVIAAFASEQRATYYAKKLNSVMKVKP